MPNGVPITYFLLTFEKYFILFFVFGRVFYIDFPNYARAFAESKIK